MAVSYVQLVGPWSASDNATSGSFTPTAGDAIVVWSVSQGGSGNTITVSGSTGTYSAVSPPGTFVDSNFSEWNASENASANAGAQTITVSTNGTQPVVGIAAEYSGVTACSGSKNLVGNPPGAITGNAATVPSGGILVALCCDSSNLSGGIITSPAGTSRSSGSTLNGYPFAITEYAGTGASITPSFTSSTGAADNFVIIQFVLSPSAGPGATIAWIT